MDHEPVKSSSVTSFAYDPDTQILEIQFTGGGLYRYYDVPPTTVQQIRGADSVGKAFQEHVRGGGFKYEKLT